MDTLTNRNFKAKWIVIEGIDGSGKSTVVNMISKLFYENKVVATISKGLGGTDASKHIRTTLLSSKRSKQFETLGMLYSLLDCLETVVLPSLNRNEFVLLDRYLASFYAYQVSGRMYKPAKAYMSETFTGLNVLPDIFIYVKVPQSVADNRISYRDNKSIEESNHFDKEDHKFKCRVYNGFEEFLQNPDRYIYSGKKVKILTIENTGNLDDLEKKVKNIIEDLLI